MLNSYAILFLDCQSTGASFLNSHLLEVACNDRSWVVAQQEPVPRKILRLVGMSAEEVDQGLDPEQVFSELSVLIDDETRKSSGKIFAVSHFARFEQAHLDRLWLAHAQRPFPLPIICTHKLTKLLHPRLPNHGIRALAGWFGMPLDEGKRASNHVAATEQIWNASVKTLEEQGISSLERLMEFLHQKSARTTGRKEFLIPREKRLALPSDPGVYRYLDRAGRVLYVGKATSLKSRVNSYFTGGCRGDHRKLEMLAQAVDVEVTTTDAPIFAGLLEYDEIRRLMPPYNVAFKGNGRDPLKDLNLLLGCLDEFDPEKHPGIVKDCFYGLTDFNLLREGVACWRSDFGISPGRSLTQRDLLNLGIPFLRQWIVEERERRKRAQDASDEEEHAEADENENESEDQDVEVVWTSELVAAACQRIVRRAIRHYIRTRWLQRIAGASIDLYVRQNSKCRQQGRLSAFKIELKSAEIEPDLRRVRVLLHELRRAESKGGTWRITKPWSMTVPFWI